MRQERLSVENLAEALSDVLYAVGGGVMNGKLRFFNRRLVTIGHDRVAAKDHVYLRCENSPTKHVSPGQEWDRPVRHWVNEYAVGVRNIRYVSISTKESRHYGWYACTSETKQLRLDGMFMQFRYFQTDHKTQVISDFISSISKNKRKALEKLVRKYRLVGEDDFVDRSIVFYRGLCREFDVVFSVRETDRPDPNNPESLQSFYSAEPVPTQAEERDRLIGEIIRSKRIIDN